MRRSLAFVSAFAIFLWVLPLGAFIAPSQESTVCDGRRAFHMCSTAFFSSGQKGLTSQKAYFTGGSGFEKTGKSASGLNGGDFTDASFSLPIPAGISRRSDDDFLVPSPAFFFVPEPVPKHSVL